MKPNTLGRKVDKSQGL